MARDGEASWRQEKEPVTRKYGTRRGKNTGESQKRSKDGINEQFG
jgi:hypothetical protein